MEENYNYHYVMLEMKKEDNRVIKI